eukprot:1161680-Pelagomonas_calceolata.AAC.1
MPGHIRSSLQHTHTDEGIGKQQAGLSCCCWCGYVHAWAHQKLPAAYTHTRMEAWESSRKA